MRKILVIAVLALGGLAACGGSSSGPGDASARAACRKFYALSADAKAGVVKAPELVSRSRSIYQDARYSTYKPVVAAATSFASDEASTGDSAASVKALDNACKPLKL